MKEYKIETPCPKCGERGATSKYCNGLSNEFTRTEWITRTCKNCEYKWQEKPLNN